eukprot:4414024-Alexandrium_andersonii.AAC.1
MWSGFPRKRTPCGRPPCQRGPWKSWVLPCSGALGRQGTARSWQRGGSQRPVSYTHLRAHETSAHL